MAFPRRLLNDDEDIALDLHPHWWFLFPQICLLAGAIVIGIAALLFASETSWIIALAGLLVLVALANFGIRYAQWSTTNFVVTTDRLIYRHGVVSKHGIEIPLERVNTVFFSQSLFERMLRSGDLVIESAGEMGRQNFSNVRRPSAVQNEIYRQMESNENRKFERLGVQARSAAPADSIPAQIRELEQLRREGVVSDEEFRAKKQQLLDRM